MPRLFVFDLLRDRLLRLELRIDYAFILRLLLFSTTAGWSSCRLTSLRGLLIQHLRELVAGLLKRIGLGLRRAWARRATVSSETEDCKRQYLNGSAVWVTIAAGAPPA